MPDHHANRRQIIQVLHEELVGPCPSGEEIDCTHAIRLAEPGEFFRPHHQRGSGEEILGRDSPINRYGVGVLYPLSTPVDSDDADDTLVIPDDVITVEEEADHRSVPTDLSPIHERISGEDLDDDFDISLTNALRPSSLGVSFLAILPPGGKIVVDVAGGRYRRKDVFCPDQTHPRSWWLRSPVALQTIFDIHGIHHSSECVLTASTEDRENLDDLNVRVEAFARPFGTVGQQLLTVCLVNRTNSVASLNERCLFQTSFKVTIVGQDDTRDYILPYPAPVLTHPSEEDSSLALLYRAIPTFAVGHGCAANWELSADGSRAISVRAEVLPVVETPSITPDIFTDADQHQKIEVSMAALAGLVDGDDGIGQIEVIITRYQAWITERQQEISTLDSTHQIAARRHMDACKRIAQRMIDGLTYLRRNSQARLAFQLANHAVLLQQVRSRSEPRKAIFDTDTLTIAFSEPYPAEEMPVSGRGYWRPFQIAFLLSALQSTAEPDDVDREIMELLWFPTGGGKTEAYLGLTAFTIFLRRLRDPEDTGVQVLMRYTLRLLTAQQFQRASGLICAMEYLRRQREGILGSSPFSIGIWLGSATTPNNREEARHVLQQLQRGQRCENRFMVTQCPWCGAQIGPLSHPMKKNSRREAQRPKVLGYMQRGDTVVFRCSDPACAFHNSLPIYVIDEDIYEVRPSMLIGTVDKFAMLAWRPAARALFGLDVDGQRRWSPPGLIIQDELHLISGPLGSMVGLYEAVIEALCTDHRGASSAKPKLISSTATIRGYKEQVKALYAREDAILFPPPGLDASDSFFARYARFANGKLAPGRCYVGVHANGLTSLQEAQIRTFTALLQAPCEWPAEDRDPWWTLLGFFNSLRELGTTLSLLQSRIPDYQIAWRTRMGQHSRLFANPLELTSRIPSDQVPEAIKMLSIPCTGTDRPVDICIASNIIEVGIDIPRLSLMVVVGQPKSTAQYIQVTGRIGRRWEDRPGLVVTLYSATKPRDRSHFEKFRSYHERLYAQVEPTSVTPFSPPALERALHAVMVAYARQAGSSAQAETPYPCPAALLDELRCLLSERVRIIDPEEAETLETLFRQRLNEWHRWERMKWETRGVVAEQEDAPLLRSAGRYYPRKWEQYSWSTPMSMRTVDAECQLEITQAYLRERRGE